jgi:hypothetical protein
VTPEKPSTAAREAFVLILDSLITMDRNREMEQTVLPALDQLDALATSEPHGARPRCGGSPGKPGCLGYHPHTIDPHTGDDLGPQEEWCQGCEDCNITPAQVGDGAQPQQVDAEKVRAAWEMLAWMKKRMLGTKPALGDRCCDYSDGDVEIAAERIAAALPPEEKP